jgi:protein-export membrane protein SecD
MTFGRGYQQRSIEELVKSEHGSRRGGGPQRDDGSPRRGCGGCTLMPVLFALAATLLLSGCQAVGFIGELVGTGTSMDNIDGLCAEYEIIATDHREITPEMLEQTRVIIENRVNATGAGEPIIRVEDVDRIRVALSGVTPGTDVAELVRDLITAPGVLEFSPVPDEYFDSFLQDKPLPAGMLDVEPLFDGTEIAVARIGQDATTGETVVDLELTETGARLFDEHAAEHFGERFAVVLDGIVATAPSINARRFDGRAQISGDFTPEEASALVTILKFGALPLEIREISFGTCRER